MLVTAFSQVQLRCDANQDEISQADELFSLAEQGIASTSTAADLNATHNPFFRSFASDIAVSAAAQALQPGYLQNLLGGIEQGRVQLVRGPQSRLMAVRFNLPEIQGA